MRITNQEIVTNEINNAQEVKLEVFVPVNLLADRIASMGEEVAAAYLGKLFVDEYKEALAKLNPPA